ncbi:MAG: hypothetical protein EPO36_06225 [Chloroflexota bacterium]|nr:MAG: hypothetical protein EPO36_06225 [Chloroflexota bacterium]
MSDLQRVPGPRLPLGRHLDVVAFGLIVVVGVLIAKPWGETGPGPGNADPSSAGASAAASTGVVAAPTPFEAGYLLDQAVFGPFEPNPEWSVWPGGIFVTVLYVTRETEVSATASPGPSAPSATPSAASPAPSADPGESPSTPVPQPAASPEAAAGWPASIVIGPGDHLLWLGLDTPLEWTVREVLVWRRNEDSGRVSVPVVELASQWGPHFTIIGIPVAPGSDRLAIWPMGTYDLEATLGPDGSRRTIRIEIETLDPEPTPAP